MKVSELIKMLQACVDEYGEMECARVMVSKSDAVAEFQCRKGQRMTAFYVRLCEFKTTAFVPLALHK